VSRDGDVVAKLPRFSPNLGAAFIYQPLFNNSHTLPSSICPENSQTKLDRILLERDLTINRLLFQIRTFDLFPHVFVITSSTPSIWYYPSSSPHPPAQQP